MTRAQNQLNTTSPLAAHQVCQVLTEAELGKADLNVTRPDASLSSLTWQYVHQRGWQPPWVIAETTTASVGESTAARTQAIYIGMLGRIQ